MRVKRTHLLIGLSIAGLIGVVTVASLLFPGLTAWVTKGSAATQEERLVAEANQSIPQEPPKYSREAQTVGFVLADPARAQLAAFGQIRLKGQVKNDSPGDLIVVWMVTPKGLRETALPLAKGQFDGTIYLSEGEGEYRVTLSVPARNNSSSIAEATWLKVKNIAKEQRFGPYLTSQYFASGLQMKWPSPADLRVDTTLVLNGTAPMQLDGRMLKVQVSKSTAATAVPQSSKAAESYAAVRSGEFSAQVHLGEGPGTYAVKLWLERGKGSNYFDLVAELPMANTSDKVIPQTVSVLPDGLRAQLSFDAVAAKVQNSLLTISGKLDAKDATKKLWVMAESGGKTEEQIFVPVKDGLFKGTVPLTLGQGDYKLKVRVPESGSYWKEAAILQVTNTGTNVVRTITYTDDGDKHGIALETPVVGEIKGEYRLAVKGTLTKDLGKLSFLMAKVKKGDQEAQYRLPVKGGRFEGEIWLRFGTGEHEVTLFAPDSATYYRGLVQFKAENSGSTDQRETAPSFAIESDDPTIIAKAQELTAGVAPDQIPRVIFDWVAKTVSYEYAKANLHRVDPDEGAVLTLQQRTGVCRDYAALAVALMRAAGVQAHVVTGKATSGWFPQDHAWLEARVGDRWVEMDPTFAAGYIQNGKFVFKYDDRYYDPNPDFFKTEHKREGIQY